MADPLDAMQRTLDTWADLLASMQRTRDLTRKALADSRAVVAEINADRARRGLPPVGEG